MVALQRDGNMDKLKELLASKKRETEQQFGGKKYMKRSELEQLKVKKLKEEEKAERARKVLVSGNYNGRQFLMIGCASHLVRLSSCTCLFLHQEASRPVASPVASSGSAGEAPAEPGKQSRPASRLTDAGTSSTATSEVVLTKDEIMRRLRRLKEPITLFGETEQERAARLEQAERNVTIVDEAAGGQQANFNIEYARQQRKRSRQEEDDRAQPSGAALDPQQEALMAAFRAAAEEHATTNLPLEDALARQLRSWCADWEADLEARPEEAKRSPAGHQATVRYRETVEYLKPLLARLRNRTLEPEMLAGLKLIIESMKGRNYLHAYKIYMGIAIGNSPWPIGVTQVGLHERSAREKISFKSSMSTVRCVVVWVPR